MGERTGRPRGRPPGAKNKRSDATREAAQAAAEALEGMIPAAFIGDAHAFLMAVYKDPTHDLDTRIDAAKAAIRFEKPVLSSVEAKVGISYDDLSEDELDAEIAREAVAAGLAAGSETVQ